VGVTTSCPRCGGAVRPPGLMVSQWRCDGCGPVPPLHVPAHIDAAIVASAAAQAAPLPLWCPWPLPPGWMVTGVAWAGDGHTGTHATVLAFTGPAPLSGGPADALLVAEEPGVGLGNRYARLAGPDPGPYLAGQLDHGNAAARVKAAGWPTPLWSVGQAADRSAFVGEARGMWLFAVTFPATAGYLLAEDVHLLDLTEWVPPELVFGAPSPYLHGGA